MIVPNEAKLKLARAVCASEVRIVRVAGAALFWLLARQAEEGGRKDELACRARGQTDFHLRASLPAFVTERSGFRKLAVWRASFRARGHALSSLLARSVQRLAVAQGLQGEPLGQALRSPGQR